MVLQTSAGPGRRMQGRAVCGPGHTTVFARRVPDAVPQNDLLGPFLNTYLKTRILATDHNGEGEHERNKTAWQGSGGSQSNGGFVGMAP
jgi:hypothetical protein